MDKKVAILIESDFYENEIFYYQQRFPEEDIEVDFLTRLWGQDSITFQGHEFNAPFECSKSFENISEQELNKYSAVIIPAGIVADRLRYTEDVSQLPPATKFMKKAFADKNIIKGIICHGLWLLAPAPELVKGRKLTVHNNMLGDAQNMGAEYIDEDLVVDGDLVTARTGGHANIFARKIIELINSK